jgi:hypothetical protein
MRRAGWQRLLSKPLFRKPPHRDYSRHRLLLEPLFTDIFPDWTRMSARTDIFPRMNIPRSVLYGWKTRWTQNSQWRPWNMSVHGVHHRAFTDEEESRIVNDIINDYIVPGKQFVLSTFRELVLARYGETGRDPDKFKCSAHFAHDFKRRHRFSTRRFHLPAEIGKRDGLKSPNGPNKCTSCLPLSIITAS